MRINSVSQLDEKDITIPQLIQSESYIETSFLSGISNDLSLYESYKLPFHTYNQNISTLIEDLKDYIDGRVGQLCSYIDKLSLDLSIRLDNQDKKITDFILCADNDWFVHKNANYKKPEQIYGTKIFVDVVGIDGAQSMLSSENVIEGTTRKALWS